MLDTQSLPAEAVDAAVSRFVDALPEPTFRFAVQNSGSVEQLYANLRQFVYGIVEKIKDNDAELDPVNALNTLDLIELSQRAPNVSTYLDSADHLVEFVGAVEDIDSFFEAINGVDDAHIIIEAFEALSDIFS